jgi:uncharacterized membrane protein HdeD (DUF308 family)
MLRSTSIAGILREPEYVEESSAERATSEGGAMNQMFGEREILEEAADRWWIFLVTGIAWLVFALLVFQWDYTTVYAISILFGVVAIVAAMNEFMAITYSTTGWKWIHGLLGVLFVLVGIWALWNPYDTFATLAALVGFFLLIKGIFDVSVAFMTKDEFELWWLQLVVGLIELLLAFWVAGNFREKAILLVVYVGIIALARGITELFVAFKLKGLRRRLAAT